MDSILSPDLHCKAGYFHIKQEKYSRLHCHQSACAVSRLDNNSINNTHLTAIFWDILGKLISEFISILDSLERMMKVVVKTVAMRPAKRQSNRHHQQTNSELCTGRMPILSFSRWRQSSGKMYHILWTCLPQALSSPGFLPSLF